MARQHLRRVLRQPFKELLATGKISAIAAGHMLDATDQMACGWARVAVQLQHVATGCRIGWVRIECHGQECRDVPP